MSTPGCSLQNVSSFQKLVMIDSTGHRSQDAGNYDQCVGFGNTHCVAYVNYELVGLCLPAACGVADVTNVFSEIWLTWILENCQTLLSYLEGNPGYPIYASCGDNSVLWPATATWVVSILFLLTLCVLVASSMALLDKLLGSPSSASSVGRRIFVQSFSLQTNIAGMLKMSGDRSGTFASLNGVRVLSLSLVILGHTVFFLSEASPEKLSNTATFFGTISGATFQVIPSAEFAVDTFFFLSALLASYLLVKGMRGICKGGSGSSSRIGAGRGGVYKGASLNSDIASAQELLLSDSSIVVKSTANPSAGAAAAATSAGATPRSLCLKLTIASTYYIVHRWLRIVPLLLMVIGLSAWVIPSLYSGPFWIWTGFTQSCSQYWWTNMFFVNTLIPWENNFDSQCLGWTWYLSHDFILSIAFTLPLSLIFAWKPLAGWICGSTALLAMLIQSGVIVGQNDLTVLLNPQMDQSNGDYTDLFYDRPWTRSPSYIIGIIMAFALHAREDHAKAAAKRLVEQQDDGEDSVPLATSSLHSSSVSSSSTEAGGGLKIDTYVIFFSVLQCFALTVLGLLFYITTTSFAPLSTFSSWTDAGAFFYTWASRPIWVTALGILLYCCIAGYGGPVGYFLSLPIWEPLARLSFGAYLVHPTVMIIYYQAQRSPLYYMPINVAGWYISNAAYAFLTAAILYLTVEAPTAALEKAASQALGLKH